MSFSVNVDPTNPGQFFACCGLLELADRRWPGAEGWFVDDARDFRIACTGTLGELLRDLGNTDVRSSLSDIELKRLGSLMSLEKTKLTEATSAEKDRLAAAWKQESLHIGAPFNLYLDWWRDMDGKRTELKTWAAKELVLYKLRPLVHSLRAFESSDLPITQVLSVEGEVDCVPFYFDSSATGQSTARDVGFSLYDLRDVIRDSGAICPATECLGFIGLQRCQPVPDSGERYVYAIWTTPVNPSVLAAYASGLIQHQGQRNYSFTLIDRTKYMKAFSVSKPLLGDHS